MSRRALIVTYHAIEQGPAPLCLDPSLLRDHLDCLVDCGATTLTISELAEALERGTMPDRAVALTFDDGFASVAREAGPLVAERGLRATVYCVAGFLGDRSDWPTQPAGAPRLALADARELAGLAGRGFEIGSHGMDHAPLDRVPEEELDRELRESRSSLEREIGVPVRSFAYPYGARATPMARGLVEQVYASACATDLRRVGPAADPFALPRVDAHYLRRPALLRGAVTGSLGPYLAARRVGARARRLVVKDY